MSKYSCQKGFQFFLPHHVFLEDHLLKFENLIQFYYHNHEYHTCYAADSPCISEHEYTITWSSWCLLEVITLSAITGIHLYVRRSLKQKQKVPQDTKCKDFLYALYCSTCSLAQQYRALDIEENTIVEL